MRRRVWPLVCCAGLLLTGCGEGGSAEGAEPTDDPGATSVDLPTSDWEPGQGGDAAQISGVLAVNDAGCVYLEGDSKPIWAVWPKGYSAEVGTDGRLTLFDASGDAVAHDGDQLALGGGYGSGVPVTGADCVRGGAELAFVQSNIDGSNK